MSHLNWETLSKKVYWDRDVPLDRWIEKITAGHRSYLPDAISTMTPAEFVHYYGVDLFKANWPRLRATLPKSALKYASVYDLAWSKAIGGGWNLRPTADFFEMPAKRRAFLIQVAKTPGRSIYAISKALGLQYRRAHDHAVRLRTEGKIRSFETVDHNHRTLKLFPAYKHDVLLEKKEHHTPLEA
jgi:hypothetical protein